MHQGEAMQQAKHLKSIRTLLDRWRGNTARLWAFQAAHCHLTIRIERRGARGNLHVMCLEPEFIHGPVQWEDCAFEAQVDPENPRGGYILRDTHAGFEVKAGDIEVKENCKPLT
jgi:hypothetical protein